MARHLSLALLGTLALAPCAFAQDAGTSSASGKHVAIVGGVALNNPTGNADINGARTNLDGEAVGTLGASWFINDNIAIEGWGASKAGYRMTTANGKVGSVDAQPYALSGQYHFGSPDKTVRPFVGLGYYQMNYDNESAQAGAALAGQRIGVETAQGPMATVGADLNLGEHWFARGDVRYLHGNSDLSVNGVKAGEVKANPVVVGVGIGTRW
ncbi:OmpW family protein [Lysobacter sp. TY2-98]|uniref:OmpW/AlkL family protein n=1 Tax=Lysobacter sp. TY2-98 TaxID=2290922 RepID=UPI000E20AC48|nr:OmpW family outer membrane protein [Lysobacter sp. TY2-98]AXK72746.1 OmpW family protein [Lysobacter sp. TY2-98]